MFDPRSLKSLGEHMALRVEYGGCSFAAEQPRMSWRTSGRVNAVHLPLPQLSVPQFN